MDSLENESIKMEKSRDERLASLKDSCQCIDSYFSTKGKPLLEHSFGDYHFIVCGYSGSRLIDTIIGGKRYSDGSIYFSGFEIFECNVLSDLVISNGEYHIDKVQIVNDRIEVSRCEYVPIGKDWKREIAPVFTIQLIVQEDRIKLDTSFVLDISNITEKNINDFKNGKLGNIDPVMEIYCGLITAIKEYPDYNEAFYTQGPYDGAPGPVYNYAKKYFKLFEKKKYQ